ncbi:MAG TPA: hypothetical protein VI356_22440 [Myxococcales bacterium]
MKTSRLSCALLLALACTGQNSGEIAVVAENATAATLITHVRVTITPAAVTRDLTVDPQAPTRFTGSFAVPAGTQVVAVEAFTTGEKSVGTGAATVTVLKGATVQAQIRIFDATGPVTGPDHSPVVTSLVTPTSAQVGDQLPVSATAFDADQDPMAFSWTASPAGCGTFAAPAASTTSFTAGAVTGTCTVTFTVTANGKSDSKSASVAIAAATGSIDVVVTYVPQPVISSIAFSSGATALATVQRSAADATIRVPFHKGTAYTITFSFDPWPAGTAALTDSCGGTIVQPAFVANATSASATWTPTVSAGACVLVATVTRETTLTDSLSVVVLPVP